MAQLLDSCFRLGHAGILEASKSAARRTLRRHPANTPLPQAPPLRSRLRHRRCNTQGQKEPRRHLTTSAGRRLDVGTASERTLPFGQIALEPSLSPPPSIVPLHRLMSTQRRPHGNKGSLSPEPDADCRMTSVPADEPPTGNGEIRQDRRRHSLAWNKTRAPALAALGAISELGHLSHKDPGEAKQLRAGQWIAWRGKRRRMK